jgi:hypothetical protein
MHLCEKVRISEICFRCHHSPVRSKILCVWAAAPDRFFFSENEKNLPEEIWTPAFLFHSLLFLYTCVNLSLCGLSSVITDTLYSKLVGSNLKMRNTILSVTLNLQAVCCTQYLPQIFFFLHTKLSCLVPLVHQLLESIRELGWIL